MPVIATTRTQHLYGPEFLHRFGPMMVGSWWFPQAVAQARAAAGEKLPPKKSGAILLDTGADGTAISQETARALGLKPTRMQDGLGAGGAHRLPVFLATIELAVKDPRTKVTSAIAWEQEVIGIPSLGGRTVNCGDVPLEITGLLGRDFLRYCRFSYDGLAGVLSFEIDLAAMKIHPSR